MCQANPSSDRWLRLTPDNNGSYENGTWTFFASAPEGIDGSNVIGATPATCDPCPYAPADYASAVLKDGRVVIIGGEYNTNGYSLGLQSETGIGFLFDPSTNSWSSQLTQPFSGTYLAPNGDTLGFVGDSQSVVLKDGTMLIASHQPNSNIASFDPSTLTFTALNPIGKDVNDNNEEEGWTILPNGTILNVDSQKLNSYQIYDPVAKSWSIPGTTAGVPLADADPGNTCDSYELGPAVARPDGTIIQFSGNSIGENAVYTVATNTWAVGPTFPNNETVADGPASLLINGHVLVLASPVAACGAEGMNVATFPSRFYEFDGIDLNDVTPSNPGTNGPDLTQLPSYVGRMLVLPSGRVLLTYNPNDTEEVWTYMPAGEPLTAWAPAITSVSATILLGQTYSISGTQFNGFSQGAAYGDDAQMATNYPLVRITNSASGHVFYARTHDHSMMGVEAVGSTDVRSTNFDVPANLELGASTLVVVTNGIPSAPMSVIVSAATLNGPVLGAISPTSALVRGEPFTMSVTGSNFLSGASINFNGAAQPTTFISSTSLTATISAVSIAAVGSDFVTVTNPAPDGGTSGASTFTVNNPLPVLNTISPTSVGVGTSGFNLALAGSNFNVSSSVQFNGQAVPTTFVSSTALTASIPASDVATAATDSVTVSNPAPGGGSSAAASFSVSTPGFVLNVGGSGTASVNAGGTAVYKNAIVLASVDGFSFDVVLKCSTTAPLSTCSINPSSLTPGRTATIQVFTTGNGTSIPLANDGRPTARILLNAPILLLLLLVMLALSFAGRTHRGRLNLSLPLTLVFLSLVFQSSCASNQTNRTPAGTYSVNVTGVSGSISHTITLTMTVK